MPSPWHADASVPTRRPEEVPDRHPPAGTSAPTASLYSLSQDLAIETARDEVLNGMNIVNKGDFGVTPPQN